MFYVKRDNSNKNFIIKGLFTALLLSAFIYLSYFGLENKILNTSISLLAIYFLLTIERKSLFYAGFFTGLFWFYWIAISLQYYDLVYLAPILLLIIGLLYGFFFYLFALVDDKLFRVLFIFAFTFFEPFGFNWFKLELLFLDSYFDITKEALALILVSVYAFTKLKKTKYLVLLPLFFALSPSSITYKEIKKDNINMPLDISMPQLNINQYEKWENKYRAEIINTNLELINEAIKNKKDLIILPETTFPTVLNKSDKLLEILKEKSFFIDIHAGSLLEENNSYYNATYYISKGEIQIAKKVVLVPFGEEIPLPKFLVDLINNTFYDGASDYKKADLPTDFNINGIKFRNAICYEATSKEIYKDLNDVKFIIATSNNAWFTPSIEPTLQKLLLRFYAKQHNVTIYHVINGSKNYIIKP